MVDGVVMERLHEGRRPQTMDCRGGGRRVGSRRAGVEIIMVAARAHSEATTHKQPYKQLYIHLSTGAKKNIYSYLSYITLICTFSTYKGQRIC